MLAALMTYASGKSVRGSNTWTPLPEIIGALDKGFYMAFDNVEPTGKRILYGLDVSGSMGGGTIAGVPGLTPRHGAAAMAMASAKRETRTLFGAFTGIFRMLDIQPDWPLHQVMKNISAQDFGTTDCAQPMIEATKNGWEIDAFCVLTDNETWAGTIKPFEALKKYRKLTGIPAKMVVVGMTSTGFSIADPTDGGMLDVVGFSTDVPQAIADFIRG